MKTRNMAEQIEKGIFINPHNSKGKKYLKRKQHKVWRKYCKTLNELNPKYNRYKGWEG